MISLLGLVKTAAVSMTRERIEPGAVSVLKLRVGPADIDENLHMTNARYPAIMNRGRLDLGIRTGLLGAAVKNDLRFLLGALALRYRRDLKPFEAYQLHSQAVCWDEAWITFEQRFMVDGRARAVGLARMQLRGKEGPRNPAELFELAGAGNTQSPPVPEHVAAWLAWLQAEKGRLP